MDSATPEPSAPAPGILTGCRGGGVLGEIGPAACGVAKSIGVAHCLDPAARNRPRRPPLSVNDSDRWERLEVWPERHSGCKGFG